MIIGNLTALALSFACHFLQACILAPSLVGLFESLLRQALDGWVS